METIAGILIVAMPSIATVLAVFLIAGIVFKIIAKKSNKAEKLNKISKACFIVAIVCVVAIAAGLISLKLMPEGDYMAELEAIQ